MSACAKESLLEQYVPTVGKKSQQSTTEQPQILISPITATDITEVHALECRVYSFPWSPTIIADCINSGYECWMIKHSGKVIAYSIMMIGAAEGHLLNLCVDSDFRRQGYARYLLRLLSDIAIVRNAKRMLLEVRESNRQAINLYHNFGFRQISRRVNYYPAETDREHALVLAKLL
ncbi:MAG: ribosomal-protein-alanine N-acetyltransferase [Gammaproteobacteria bacterium]|nr:ribosomal-protein-alanine N-acetyltransferase [Gammaproteobacteria bacterium]